ncbi:unnamed protein product [Pedinophyceae sp. YPF-701]|nr:unnamed protein product [Pedinophyceae sp. YPF-701]
MPRNHALCAGEHGNGIERGHQSHRPPGTDGVKRRREGDDEQRSDAGGYGARAAKRGGKGRRRGRESEDHSFGAGFAREGRAALSEERRSALEAQRAALPVAGAREALLDMVRANPVTVIIGETGSGKTTQIPRYLHEAGLARGKCIACTQPRRVAAVTVARRVSEEMNCKLGREVGYSVRFEDVSSGATRIRYMTDGMLLREAIADPDMRRYGAVVIDEAHERTVLTDVLLGLLKQVLARRKSSFKVVVMSATLDAGRFSSFFDNAPIGYVKGRTYPVDIRYTTEPEEDYVDGAVNTAIQAHLTQGPGDILMFLTGQEEIEAAERMLRQRADAILRIAAEHTRGASGDGAAGAGLARDASAALRERLATGASDGAPGPSGGEAVDVERTPGPAGGPLGITVCPLYAAMSPDAQVRAFEPARVGHRKIIVATNIAETSVTINGVRFVVDVGLVKARGYNARLGAESLQVVPISQAQAKQRAGRAGREAPGICFRVFTERAYRELRPATTPDILRSNLASVALQMKALGISDLAAFPFVDPPPKPALLRALEQLYALGALARDGSLSRPLGERMARLPVDPMYAKALLAAAKAGCVAEALVVVSMVSGDGAVFVAPAGRRQEADAARRKFKESSGDHLTLLGVWEGYHAVPEKARGVWCADHFVSGRFMRKAVEIHKQLTRQVEQMGLVGGGSEGGVEEDAGRATLRRALAAGLFVHAAKRQPDGTYVVLATGQTVHIHPSSVLHAQNRAGQRGGAGGEAEPPRCIVFDELVRTSKQYAKTVLAIEESWLPEVAPDFFSAGAA